MSAPTTTPGRLSDAARHVVLPSGIVSTGWPAVRDTCAGFGVTFDPWQDGAGRVILAKRDDGSYACSIGGVVLSIPRQVGKTFLIGAIVFALCLLNPGLTVLWTAHRLRTANETFSKMQAFARRKKVAPHVARIILGSGDEEIKFQNGSRILFGARERGFGRGFDDVDVEVFDEAQILTENATDDMIPAMNTAANPLPIYVGTPPKPTDPSEVFTAKRNAALSGEDEDTAYIECSADPDADPDDPVQWSKANPSFPGRTSRTSMLRMKKNLSADSYLREGLGIWGASSPDAIDAALWSAALVPDAEMVGPRFAIDKSLSGDRVVIAAAGPTPDGRVLVEVIESQPGTAWVTPRLVELLEAHGRHPVWLEGSGPARSLLPDLVAAGIEVHEATAREYSSACGWLVDNLAESLVCHLGQAELTAAAGAVKKGYRGSTWVWVPKSEGDSIAEMVACTLAAAAHGTAVDEPEPFVAVEYG